MEADFPPRDLGKFIGAIVQATLFAVNDGRGHGIMEDYVRPPNCSDEQLARAEFNVIASRAMSGMTGYQALAFLYKFTNLPTVQRTIRSDGFWEIRFRNRPDPRTRISRRG
jgi:hypothetical protein